MEVGPAPARFADSSADAIDVAGTRSGGFRRPRQVLGTRRYRPAVLLGTAAVLAQVAYPLLAGPALRTATIVAVCCFAASSLAHAAATFGWSVAGRVLVVAGGLGLGAEATGVHTGFPFGSYHYAGTLGPQLVGVPLVVPLAWTMMAYPAVLVGRRLVGRRLVGVAAIGGSCLASWDLYLDPQMVDQGHWRWSHPTPALPGVPGIPISNYLGWLVVAVLIVAALHAAVPDLPGSRRERAVAEVVPAGLLAWTWVGSALANLAFFDRPAVALYGGVGMGLTVLPYLSALVRAARSTR